MAPDRPVSPQSITTERAFPGLPLADVAPISMAQPPGDDTNWIIAGRLGNFFRFADDDAVTSKVLVLDIQDRMQFTDTTSSADSQQWGVTSFAFHPDFPASPYLFVAYNAKPGAADPVSSIVARFTSFDGGQTFDPDSEQLIIEVVQEKRWHHLGQIAFGNDGYLYIGLGDGDKRSNSQDTNDLSGSILRLDIDQGLPYTIPPDNPLVGTGARAEIYAWGVRNPWRFSFDRDTGELWTGDVGALLWEEVNQIVSGGNYGWADFEGNECIVSTCDTTGKIPPVLAIEHPTALSVIGGFVYRGSAIPSLQGTYVFGDGSINNVSALTYDNNGQAGWSTITQPSQVISGFAEAADGEIYMFRFYSEVIHRLIPAGPPPVDTFPDLLSETGCVVASNPLVPASGVIPYTVNSPLWSDDAEKDRWLAIPDGTTIGIAVDGDFDFPIGTVLMKTFSFFDIPFETRLFVRHDDGGWAGYSYEWNETLSDAVLLPAGKTKQVAPGVTWEYPSRSDCMRCHTNIAGFSLGPEIAQLNGRFVYPSSASEANQLETLEHIGMFTSNLPDSVPNLPALAGLSTGPASLERQAKSYLHGNCSMCHRPNGPVQSAVDFRYQTPIESMNACYAIPDLGDLGDPDARILVPGDPSKSIISLRMHSLDVNRMPPLATAVVDPAGTVTVDAWISQPDVCVIYPDSDGDLIRDNSDNCTIVANADQRDTDAEGFGNKCDPDLSNDGVVDFGDLPALQQTFFSQDGDPNWNPHADMNGDGVVDFADLPTFQELFFQSPGPSGLTP